MKKIIPLLAVSCVGLLSNCVYAKYYVVRFDTTKESQTVILPVRVASGKTIEAPQEPVKPGYDFIGWYHDGYEFNFDTPIREDMTLEAHFSKAPTEYTITYHLNEGEEVDGAKPTSYTIDDEVIFGDASRTSYGGDKYSEFINWYFDPEFKKCAKHGWESGKKTGNIDLYPKWNNYVSTITYDANPKHDVDPTIVVPDNPTKFTFEDDVTILSPTRNGYNFKYWYYLNENGEEVPIEGGWNKHTVFGSEKEGMYNLTLYAKWEAGEYTLKFVTNGGCRLRDGIQEDVYYTVVKLAYLGYGKYYSFKLELMPGINDFFDLPEEISFTTDDGEEYPGYCSYNPYTNFIQIDMSHNCTITANPVRNEEEATLEETSWETIEALANAHLADEVFSIGDTKALTFYRKARIIDFDHDVIYNSDPSKEKVTANITFNVVGYPAVYDYIAYGICDDYTESSLCDTVTNTALPNIQEWTNVTPKMVEKLTHRLGEIKKFSAQAFPLSSSEYSSEHIEDGEGATYAYYREHQETENYYSTWLRTQADNDSAYVVRWDGKMITGACTTPSCVVSAAFCL